jgi:AcrR family transcriptional regulator
MATRGADTREQILEHATDVARHAGLDGLTIGVLAEDLKMSKSGLFAHFGSKEALQQAVLQYASDQFVEGVVRPGLQAPRGIPRLRKLFEGWLEWGVAHGERGGCLFVAASVELDDRPGPVRDVLVGIQRDWLELLSNVIRAGQADGKLAAEADPERVAGELYGILLFAHLAGRLLADPTATDRARQSFDSLCARLSPVS